MARRKKFPGEADNTMLVNIRGMGRGRREVEEERTEGIIERLAKGNEHRTPPTVL